MILPTNPFETLDNHLLLRQCFHKLGSDIEEVPKNGAESSYI